MEKKSLKRPKIEQKKEDEESLDALFHSDEAEDEEESQMTEEALRLLIHKMETAVHKYRTKMERYKSKMEFAEKKVIKTKEMLSRLQSNKVESFVKKPLLILPPKVLSKSTLASSSSHPHIFYKGNTEENRQLDLMQELNTRNTPSLLNFNSSNLLSSQHKRKLRCLEVCPNTSPNTRDIIFATSALDGQINVWEVESLSSKNSN